MVNGYLDSHVHIYRRKGGHLDFCGKLGNLILTMVPEYDSMNVEFFFTAEERADGTYMRVRHS